MAYANTGDENAQIVIPPISGGGDVIIVTIEPVPPNYPEPGPQVVITEIDNNNMPTGLPVVTTIDDLDW
jgi:hypothetical protein